MPLDESLNPGTSERPRGSLCSAHMHPLERGERQTAGQLIDKSIPESSKCFEENKPGCVTKKGRSKKEIQ